MLIELYDTIERETAAFRHAFGVHCPDGCGICCEHFVPDLTELEASLIAAYLLFVHAKEGFSITDAFRNAGDSSGCPLYDPDSSFHCTVYPARGMVCRLFGACPSEDKLGKAVFRACKYNTDGASPRFIDSAMFAVKGCDVPTMHAYGIQFSALEQTLTAKPLADAVLDEIGRLRFLAAYVDSDSRDGGGGSGPVIPAPAPLAC